MLFKAAKKARFEFFAYDFVVGAVLASVIAAFTLGSWDTHDLTFQDNFILIGVRKMIVAFAAGAVASAANVVLLGSVAVGGMAVGFPIAFAVSSVVLAVWIQITLPGANPVLSIGGAAAALIAVVVCAIAYHNYLAAQRVSQALVDPKKTSSQSGKTAKAIVLAILAGLLLSAFFLLLARATSPETGLAPYSAALVISAGMFFASLLIIPLFLNFPVKGQPLTVTRYFKIEKRHHIFGVLAGIIWMAGLLAGLASDNIPAGIQPSPVAAFILSRSVPVVALFWGLFIWREMAGAPARVYTMMAAFVVLYLVGIGMLAAAPMYGR